MQIDAAKNRREFIRWIVLLALYNNSPDEAPEQVLLSIVRELYPDASELELRKQLDYLAERELVRIRKTGSNIWWAELMRYGTDLVEGNAQCEPGIARPTDYRVK